MAFIVSARKYRPSSFGTLIGQDNISKTLKNSILSGQMAHAYLFCGPRGVGKTSTARIFAKTINCYNPGQNMEPCCECESCRSFDEGRSYCIHELDAASNNSVEDIRTLIDQVRIPPQIGKYSVFIIDEVHMLSTAAFNAFLKTLEEPPAHAIFILATTEKHKILPTILSRCQTYDFNRISIEDMVKNLKDIANKEGVTISEDALHIIAQKADGAMRDALTLFDQTVAFCGNEITYDMVIKNLNVLDYDYYFNLTDCFLVGDYVNTLLLFDEVISKGFNALHFIAGLSQHIRDLIVCKNKASRSLATLAPSVIARYDDYSARCSIKFLYDALSITTSCESSYKNSGNSRLLIEFALMKLSQLCVSFSEESASSIVEKNITVSHVQKVSVSEEQEQPKRVATEVKAKAEEQPLIIEEKKEVAPVSPVSKVSVGASIRNLMKELEEDTSILTEKEIDIEENLIGEITESNIQNAWKEVLSTISQPNLHAELSRSFPVYNKETHCAVQYVSNENQKIWIMNKCIFTLESVFRKALKNKDIKLLVEVRPESEDEKIEKKPYMPSDIAKAMRKKSEHLQSFEKALELEIR